MSTARIVNTLVKPAAVVSLSAEELERADAGIGESIILMHDAGEIFDFLASSLVAGYLDNRDSTLAAILRQSARAMKSAEGIEIEALGLIEMKLREGRVIAQGEVKA
ncbi:MAG: hypothetical protein KDK12_00185 [Rhodobacteraceae bacterium]|nr:hypothetical protein [Paracoccaceae bacterium]